jgi:hypothetical protein
MQICGAILHAECCCCKIFEEFIKGLEFSFHQKKDSVFTTTPKSLGQFIKGVLPPNFF